MKVIRNGVKITKSTIPKYQQEFATMTKVMCTSLNAEEGPHHETLRAAGCDVQVAPRSIDLWQSENLINLLADCDAVVAGSEPYTPKVIESLPKLRVIARTGVGFDAIDLPACDANKVVVTTTPGVNHHSVAEHTLALLFGVARGFPENDQRVRESRWKRIAHPRIMGCTLGLIGLGRIGRAVAWRAAGLGLKVLAYEPFPDQEFIQQWRIECVEMDELFSRSDYVSLHLPMSAESKHLINRETLAKMKPGSVLINTARGALVDETALYEALKSGHLRAAGLDVFEQEPLPAQSPLLELTNVLFAGHLAGLDEESHNDSFQMAAETILQLKDGEWPAFCIQNLKDTKNWSWNK